MTTAQLGAAIGLVSAVIGWLQFFGGCTSLPQCRDHWNAPSAGQARASMRDAQRLDESLAAICDAAALAPLYERSPCRTEAISAAQLADAEPIGRLAPLVAAHSEALSAAFARNRARIAGRREAVGASFAAIYERWNQQRAAAVAAVLGRGGSWGELNRTRVALYAELDRQIADAPP
jgi:hypothetical protein